MQKLWGEFHQWKGWQCGHKHGVNAVNLITTCRQSEWEHTIKLHVNSLCVTHSFGSDRLPMLDTHLRRRSLCCCPPLLLRCRAHPMAPFGPVWETSPGSPAAGKQQRLINSHYGLTLSAAIALRGVQRVEAPACCIELQHRKHSVCKSTLKNWAFFVDPEMLMYIITC